MKNQKIFIVFCLMVFSVFLLSQNRPEVKVQKISENLSVIAGFGGNVAVLKGDNQLLVIDAGVAEAGEFLKQRIQKEFNLPVKVLINTHYHQDHTGGNKPVADGAVVISHKNCLATMEEMSKIAAKSEQGRKDLKAVLLPKKVFEGQKEIKFGDEIITLINFGAGHTSGDTVVIFQKNKVICTGDLFFNNIVPYIDVRDGSDTGNWIKTIKKISKKFKGYKIIPGHGDITNMKSFLNFAKYLQYLRDSVKKGIAAGKSSEEIQGMTSFKDFANVKEINKFMTKKNNLDWVYKELTRGKK